MKLERAMRIIMMSLLKKPLNKKFKFQNYPLKTLIMRISDRKLGLYFHRLTQRKKTLYLIVVDSELEDNLIVPLQIKRKTQHL